MRFNLLGPVTVSTDEGSIVLPVGIPRDLLVVLLLNANRAVSGEQLAEAVWGQDRPAAPAAGLRNHVLRLRRQLGVEAGARIRTVTPGYLVEVRAGELDEQVFVDECRRGLQALQAGDAATAADVLAAALALWRDEPFADGPRGADVQVRAQQLAETRLLALEGRIEADLQLGRHRELVAEIRALASAHPLREALHGQLMTALYRAGRQAEALEVFQALRRTLVEELGLDPSAPLQELHRRILSADPALVPLPADLVPAPGTAPDAAGATAVGAPPARSGARYQLPADTRAFTGRARELEQLLAQARQAPRGSEAGMVVISAIDGMAGVGKSALAIHSAHRLRGMFPDGQLFIDLHGYTPGIAPLTPGAALEGLLRSLGVPPRLIPQDLGERAAFYRDRLADTRTLIVLDNAAGTAQVRPLIPGTPGCLVIVTSRRRLAGLDDVHNLALDLLPGAEAVALLHRVAGAGRIPTDHPAVPELIALCGHMPLAIRITAARLRHRRALRIEDLVEQLRDEHGRLARLQDEDRNLTAVFESSYAALPAAEQHLFRLLGLAQGPDIDAYAAANLIGSDYRTAEHLLESLLDHNLLTQHTPGRYRFHDLVRLYARQLGGDGAAEQAEREPALRRLLDYYQHTAHAADRHVTRLTRPGSPPAVAPPVAVPELPGRTAALAWMRTERDNLLAAVAAPDEPRRAVALTESLAAFLYQEGPWQQAATLHHNAAAAAAHGLGERLAEANARWDLGRLSAVTADLPAAAELLEQAIAAYEELGERLGAANARQELGHVRFLLGDDVVATDLIERAVATFLDLGDRRGEATALAALGRVRCMTADYPAAADLSERALAIFQELGEPLGEATTLSELGRARQSTGEFEVAVGLYERARAIFQDLGLRHGEANSLWDLGRVRYTTGEFGAAAGLQERALAIFQDLGLRHGEANALWDLGRVRHAIGDFTAAADLHSRALAMYQDLHQPLGEANALHGLGRVRHATGDHAEAADLLKRALALAEEVGDREAEAEVLNSTAALVADTVGSREALALYRRALDLAREIHSPVEEARALEGAARCVVPADAS